MTFLSPLPFVGTMALSLRATLWVRAATGLLPTYTALWMMARGWCMIMPINLVTLPVEFDASRRAKQPFEYP
jgi:Zn-dependent membrane protease YugP